MKKLRTLHYMSSTFKRLINFDTDKEQISQNELFLQQNHILTTE